jgi:hypothetical protein
MSERLFARRTMPEKIDPANEELAASAPHLRHWPSRGASSLPPGRTIPVVFGTGGDPVQQGLIASPQSARQQHYGCECAHGRTCGKAIGDLARSCATRWCYGPTRQPEGTAAEPQLQDVQEAARGDQRAPDRVRQFRPRLSARRSRWLEDHGRQQHHDAWPNQVLHSPT